MLKSVLAATAAAIALSAPALAQAELGNCAITATVNVSSFHVILGGTRGRGTGLITCTYLDGSVEELPVRVKTGGVGVGLGLSQTRVQILATGLGLMTGGARSFLGTYSTVSAGAQVVSVGAELGVNMIANADGFSIPLTFVARAGAGLEIAGNIGGMEILPLR